MRYCQHKRIYWYQSKKVELISIKVHCTNVSFKMAKTTTVVIPPGSQERGKVRENWPWVFIDFCIEVLFLQWWCLAFIVNFTQPRNTLEDSQCGIVYFGLVCRHVCGRLTWLSVDMGRPNLVLVAPFPELCKYRKQGEHQEASKEPCIYSCFSWL